MSNGVEKAEAGKPYVTITQGMSGFFAVYVWWNPDGFHEPWKTGIGRFPSALLAEPEAMQIAEEEDIPYIPPY